MLFLKLSSGGLFTSLTCSWFLIHFDMCKQCGRQKRNHQKSFENFTRVKRFEAGDRICIAVRLKSPWTFVDFGAIKIIVSRIHSVSLHLNPLELYSFHQSELTIAFASPNQCFRFHVHSSDRDFWYQCKQSNCNGNSPEVFECRERGCQS